MSSDDREGSRPAPPDVADRIPDDRPRPTPLWALLSRWLLGLEAWLRSHGGTALRQGIRGIWLTIAALAAFLLVGPVINPPLTLDDITEAASNATDTWIARDFDAAYELSRDDDGRLRADVTETITAFFPQDLDESGIERVLATQYQSHDLSLADLEVEIDGEAAELVVRETPERTTVVLDTGARLSGDHKFVLRYSIRDLAYPTTDDVTGAPVDLLEWSVFGPSWPQGFAGLQVSVTVPDDLTERLLRQPYGGVAWSIVSGASWLEPEEDSPAGSSVYEFTVDQNVPPHASSWFRMVFADETFTMPPPSQLFLFQTFGPLIPLAILLLTLPFSLAARAVAWSDARGRPWYIAQYDPPKDVSVAQAVQIMGRSRTRELALALAGVPRGRRARKKRPSERTLVTVWRAARRTGRVGDRARARGGFLVDGARRAQVKDGYRRIPRGFVRDWFVAAPLALTLVQLAIVRQLSHQETLSVIWWPALFVLVSLVVAGVVLWIALSARPLTRKGALVRQHLKGIDAYARQTSLLERGTLNDPLLPYAVVTADPRRAGRDIAARVESEIDDPAALRNWRPSDFVSLPRILVGATAGALLAGAITLIALLPNPLERVSNYDRYDFESPGTRYTLVESIDVAADLSVDDDGDPHLDAVTTVQAVFEEESYRVPQFAMPFVHEVEGQDLGLVVEGVRVDGETVPFDVTTERGITTVTTAMGDVRAGPAEIEIRTAYTAIATRGEGSPVSGERGAAVDRIRWAALADGWERGWTYPSTPDPVTISIRIDDEIAERALSAGWLREDPDTAEEARDWKDSSFAFGTLEEELAEPEHRTAAERGALVETRERVDGGTVHGMEAGEGEYGFPINRTYSDLGVLLEFPAGAWSGTGSEARDAAAALRALPIAVTVGYGGLAFLIAGIAVITMHARHTRRMRSGAVRDAFWWLPPSATLSAFLVFVWATGDLPASSPEILPMLGGVLLGIAGTVVCFVVVRPLGVPPRKKN